MNKILFIFDHSLTYRSYTETDAIANLKKIASVNSIFVSPKNAMSYISTKEQNISEVKLNIFLQFILSINSIRYWMIRRRKSKSFSSRIRSIKRGRREFYESKSEKKVAMPISLWIGSILSIVPFKQLSFMLKPIASKVFSNIAIDDFDIVIYVGTGGSLFLNDSIGTYLKKKDLNVRYIFIAENWDNISSKAVFNVHPDKLGVWGQSGIQNCVEIHGIDSEKAVSVGSPRVDFIANKIQSLSRINPLEEMHILFLGGSLDFDRDFEYFDEIKIILIENSIPLNLLYLPHPKNYLKYLNRVEEPQKTNSVQECITELVGKLSISRQLPPLEFYIKLFDKCKFTISPLSTMNLESILFGIPTIALDFQEKQLPNSPWATDFFEHFSELRKYDGVRIVRSNGELVSAINALYKSKVRIVRKLIADYDLSMKFDERILYLIDDKT